jgi:hypothetical protein
MTGKKISYNKIADKLSEDRNSSARIIQREEENSGIPLFFCGGFMMEHV